MLATQDPKPSLQDIIYLAKQFSPAQRLHLAKALLDSLVDDEPATSRDVNNATDEAISREREAYINLHASLLDEYPGEHVAIYGGELIDHDKDGLALSLRIYKQYPDEFVWIVPLKEQAIEEWVVRSPRFESFTSL